MLQLLEREIRREKNLEQRNKDGKSKQGPKTSIFHLAVATVTQAATQGALGVQKPQSPLTSPSKKMFESLKETLQALNNKENTSNNEIVQNGIEPSADMMPAVDNQGSQINLSVSQPVEPTVDQTLQSAEDAFFETINQVNSIIMIQYLNVPKTIFCNRIFFLAESTISKMSLLNQTIKRQFKFLITIIIFSNLQRCLPTFLSLLNPIYSHWK